MATYYASPAGGDVVFDGVIRSSRTLASALTDPNLQIGDVVQLVPGYGNYAVPEPITIKPKPAAGAGPFVLRGAPGVNLRGLSIYPPVPGQPAEFRQDLGLLVFDRIDGILVERLAFEQCWPNAIVLHGCRNVTVRHCAAKHGTNFIFARSADDAPQSRTFKIHDVIWEQDPDELLWTGKVTWCQVKQSGPEDCRRQQNKPDRHIFNGALFHAWEILGDVEIHDCTVRNAFNAIRMVGQLPASPEGCAVNNANVRIYRNRFWQIRDNVVEPEIFAFNWWVYENEIVGSYATFSFDGLSGDYFYYFANRCRIVTPHQDTDGLYGGGIPHFIGHSFKFYDDTATGKHFYTFHNSIFTCYPYAKEGTTAHWLDCNNALEFADFRPRVPEPFFFRTDVTHFAAGGGCRFRQVLTNYLGFPQSLRPSYPIDGIRDDRIFVAAVEGKFELTEESSGRGTAISARIELVDHTYHDLPAGKDIGAVQDSGLYIGPRYVAYAWPGMV